MGEQTQTSSPANCPEKQFHGNPFRYCGVCGWREGSSPDPDKTYGNGTKFPEKHEPPQVIKVKEHCQALAVHLRNQPDFVGGDYTVDGPGNVFAGFVCEKHVKHTVIRPYATGLGGVQYLGERR